MEAMRQNQLTVRIRMVEECQAKTLRSFENDSAMLALSGTPLWHAAACGPFDANMDVARREYARSVVGRNPRECQNLVDEIARRNSE